MGGPYSKKDKEAAAKKICDNAEYYKVCECCESIILFESVFCPVCDGYRFNNSLSAVKKLAIDLAKKEKTSVVPFDLI